MGDVTLFCINFVYGLLLICNSVILLSAATIKAQRKWFVADAEAVKRVQKKNKQNGCNVFINKYSKQTQRFDLILVLLSVGLAISE